MKTEGIDWEKLRTAIKGELYLDELHRHLYATDASIYKELPIGICYPKCNADIVEIIHFVRNNGLSIIPRAGGTSLAGQCVGQGLVVDVSKYLTEIIELNVDEKWVKVQPGVIRDDLNRFLAPHNLFFGPNTSTANRCNIGGMLGNNSCGTTSIVYGSTRDHVLEIKCVLSDGSEVTFNAENGSSETNGAVFQDTVVSGMKDILSRNGLVQQVAENFPHPEVKRRNHGYAIDALLEMTPYQQGGRPFNMGELLAGSEGTLAFTTEVKLSLDPLPPKEVSVLCAHFDDLRTCMLANVVAMKHGPYACELMDKIVLDCTKENAQQLANRWFVEGDPKTVLLVEFRADTPEEALRLAQQCEADIKSQGWGYAFPIVSGADTAKIWQLRAAGLGVLSNVKGDAKPVACIEDTAVRIEDMADYVDEFEAMMKNFGQEAVFYAHIGAGELHLRPIINLKKEEDVKLLRSITESTADLVKKYKGCLSGEHGDGRLRGEFIPKMYGDYIYGIFQEIKQLWDPQNIFNPGKIVNTPPMDEQLRYTAGEKPFEHAEVLSFEEGGGFMASIEKCNGSGDCRRSLESGGLMCPTYMATRTESMATRARANALREFMKKDRQAPFQSQEVKEVLDHCISCKGCYSECPSNVDMAAMKAEYMHHYYDKKGMPFRSKAFTNFYKLNKMLALWPAAGNGILRIFGGPMKGILGIAPERSLPLLSGKTWRATLKNRKISKPTSTRRIFIFADEFIDLHEAHIGQVAVKLLERLGYDLVYVPHSESGRAAISKGDLHSAKKFAHENVAIFSDALGPEDLLLGIEPSAILTFRDEYSRLLRGEQQVKAKSLAEKCLTIDEFLDQEIAGGRITADQFDQKQRHILLHTHCHQKALSSSDHTIRLLSLPAGHHVEYIQTTCCGMAGSFGYEKEHYEMSQKIGNMQLFPIIKGAQKDQIVVANGVSCRHQIKDGTGRSAIHPVEVLYGALK